MASLLLRSISPEKKLLESNFGKKSPVWMFEERGVFFAPLQQKENQGNLRIIWGCSIYILYLLKAILWGSYWRKQRALYDSLIEVQRVVSLKMWKITFSVLWKCAACKWPFVLPLTLNVNFYLIFINKLLLKLFINFAF